MSLSPVAALAAIFGHGDDDHPLWLLAIRLNILLFLAALAVLVVRRAAGLRRVDAGRHRSVLLALVALSALGLVPRLLAASNLLDSGGIPYSRMLTGYRGYLATAQCYSLFYLFSHRDIEHAILLSRLLGAATVPVVFALCRALQPRSLVFPSVAAGLLALAPLHILVSASDALTVFSGFLCALCWLLVATGAVDCLVAGVLGLALLTQVRYENALMVLPAAALLLHRRRGVAAGFCAVAGVAYAWPSLAAGIVFQDHTELDRAREILLSGEVLTNPFLAIPFLFGAALLVAMARRPLLAAGALAPWLVAGALALRTAESPHTVARGFSNWLVPLVIAAGYGLAQLAGRGRPGQVALALCLAYFAAKPVRYAGALRTRYLEMAEHDAFAAMLSAEPDGAVAVIVPDDERLRRGTGATVETMNAYRSIRRALPRPGAPLVGLTRFLERGVDQCEQGGCLFFAGLPCSVQSLDPYAPSQCGQLAAERTLELVARTTVTAAPFERCAIQVGGLRQSVCAPTERTVDFTLYRVGRGAGGGR